MSGASDRQIRDFLTRHRLTADGYRWEEQLDRFMAEMDAVRSGGPGSVKMIPSWIGTPPSLPEPLTVTAIDIGGTNVRSTVMSLGPDGVQILDRLPPFATPGLHETLTTEEFFQRIVAPLRPHLTSDRIGICFSVATTPTRDRDAVVTAGAKQLNVTDWLGKRVGESFRGAAEALHLPHAQQITVINDTIAAALGGRSENWNRPYSGFIGFIYGTGTNLAYPEPSGQWINIESGAYCGFPCGDIDDRYDSTLIDTHLDRFEKMVSGGYQGGLMSCILQTAVKESLLPADFTQRLHQAFRDHPITARDISRFSDTPRGDNPFARVCQNEQERQCLLSLFHAVTERSAFLCSVTITGALLRAHIGKTAQTPAYITAEGSTYSKQKDFKELLSGFMTGYAGARHHLHYEFHQVPDAVLRGTALSAVSSDTGFAADAPTSP